MANTVLLPDLMLLMQGQCDEQMQGMVADFTAAASWPDHAEPAAPAESTMRVKADGNGEAHFSGNAEVHSNSNGGVISNANLERCSAGNAVQDGLIASGAFLSIPMCACESEAIVCACKHLLPDCNTEASVAHHTLCVCLRESGNLSRFCMTCCQSQYCPVWTLAHPAGVTQKLCYSLIHNKAVSDRTWCLSPPMLIAKQSFNAKRDHQSSCIIKSWTS